jgi:hypothetical protein
MSEKPKVTFLSKSQDPRNSPAVRFSNFLAHLTHIDPTDAFAGAGLSTRGGLFYVYDNATAILEQAGVDDVDGSKGYALSEAADRLARETLLLSDGELPEFSDLSVELASAVPGLTGTGEDPLNE